MFDTHIEVAKAARAILNKLTLEKFDSLYEQLVTCGLRTPEHVAILMREVFEKATTQHHFIPMYADLCVRLEPDPRVSAVLGSSEKAHLNSFKRLLLCQCQTSFENLLEAESEDKRSLALDADELEEVRLRQKQRKLGNVKLIGELLVRGMLHSQLLCTCVSDLLQSYESCPEAVESLAALLTVAGPKYDVEGWPHRSQLKSLFEKISELSASKQLPTRLRFLLKDVLELRANGWQQQHSKPMPMRIEEVRKTCGSPSSCASSSPASTRSTDFSSFLPHSEEEAKGSGPPARKGEEAARKS